MKKMVKVLTIAMTLALVFAAFAPVALAADYAPYTWSTWPTQKTSSYDKRYTYALQRVLHDTVNSSLSIDGVFGSNTEQAVKNFQSANGLTVDGKVGPNTWSAMRAKLVQTSSGGSESGVASVTSPLSSDIVVYYKVSGYSSNTSCFEYSYKTSRWSVKLLTGGWELIYS